MTSPNMSAVEAAARIIRPLRDLDPTNEPNTTIHLGREAADALSGLLEENQRLLRALNGIASAVRLGSETDVQAWANLSYACQETARQALANSGDGV